MCSRLSRNRYNPVGVGLWHLFNTPALLRFRLLPSCDLSFRFTTFFLRHQSFTFCFLCRRNMNLKQISLMKPSKQIFEELLSLIFFPPLMLYWLLFTQWSRYVGYMTCWHISKGLISEPNFLWFHSAERHSNIFLCQFGCMAVRFNRLYRV